MTSTNTQFAARTTSRFLVVGDANADVIAPVSTFPREGGDFPIEKLFWASGGSAANVACGLALLGAPVRLLARVGGDPAAEVALRAVINSGVDLSLVQHDQAHATGICYAVISPGGERTFLSFRGANVDMALPHGAGLEHVTWLHVAGHALLEGQQRATSLALIADAERHEIPVSLDLCLPLLQRHVESTRALLPKLRILFGNTDEMRELGVSMPNTNLVILKRGPNGCELRGSASALVPAFPIHAVDTNGCGDSFVAAFLWAYMNGCPPEVCATFGNAAGAITASRPGAAEAMPDRALLADFVSERAPHLPALLAL